MSARRAALVLCLAGAAVLTVASAAAAAENPGVPGQPVDPTTEAQNYAKTLERQAVYDTPAYQALLTQVSAANAAHAATIAAADPERVFAADVCSTEVNGCAGDVRLNNWAANGYGMVAPVLFTARSGATLSGHVWATANGPATRPGIVITSGSAQADEQLYWFAAQALTKDGYVVLTFDPQGQGQSDTPGVSADQTEGGPAQTDGRPFFDGTEDALDFLLSTPAHPYSPVPSCNSGTSHADKQARRVANGLDTAYNPYASMLDANRIGLAGHSYGAGGVSYIAQFDPRVKAVVAWDNLRVPDPDQGTPSDPTQPTEKTCVDPAQRAIPAVTKPGLGFSADYFLPPEPNVTVPEPLAKSTESLAYTAAGIDSGQIVIRGGSHFDFDWLPNQAFGATLRGADEIAWYTDAWMDKYVKGDLTADERLLTNRWRTDTAEAAVDPNNDGNDFSFYYRSRMAIHLTGGSFYDCENLRDGCVGLTSTDGVAGSFSYLAYDTTPDVASTPPGSCRNTATGCSNPTSAATAAARPVAVAAPAARAVQPRAAGAGTRTPTGKPPSSTTSAPLADTGLSPLLPLLGASLITALGAISGARRARHRPRQPRAVVAGDLGSARDRTGTTV